MSQDSFLCEGTKLILDPKTNTTVSYLWQDGSTDSLYTVTTPGLYTLQVINSCGLYRDSILIQSGNCTLILPNGFTPNDDGKNDIFRVIRVFPVSKFSMMIFNRWGQEVFATDDMSEGWDGSFHGVQQPVDAYVWIVDLTDNHGVRQTQKGTVVLIR